MKSGDNYDVIIIGGSYAGLAAAMSLGRSLRRVLIIDAGKPCNRQTPHSHNFITHDGDKPAAIAAAAKAEVLKYASVRYREGAVTAVTPLPGGFTVHTEVGESFESTKLVFATGLKDNMPAIPGFAACWGISVIHCPYCHGYEVRNVPTGILANGNMGYEFVKLISNWTKDLTIFTNGTPDFTEEQLSRFKKHHINIIDKPITAFNHQNGQINTISFADNSELPVTAIYARPPFTQGCELINTLGCELTESGLLKTDIFQRTTVPGVYACGDNMTMGRSVAQAVATGTMAGAFVNKDLIELFF
ncbi:NAD(P)/FAD-dependent oxidoreductase [Chitinophaga sp. Cy-1792]|uniref:NAD(P)/FAD-dependent oxidoreductase n=1 Tax=Chitinophaga sp. Cy-1792 TaxID=2608339 RepID=UPI0014243C8E|nr:NAD(P)/FAD-dependent oxidoreductase [Chitinophaga sp. Cy-1792]NIG53383.1 NAD(P)/FAD-dependent oxidoreductase [Chitinophaga sp. Cy-1792]